jgi:hypothetical protein
MFALSTVYWILSVIFTVQFVTTYCVLEEGAQTISMPDGLVMLSSILLVNVSTVQPTEYWHRTLTSSASISRELTHLPEFDFSIS